MRIVIVFEKDCEFDYYNFVRAMTLDLFEFIYGKIELKYGENVKIDDYQCARLESLTGTL